VIKRKVIIQNKLGLHARAASSFVNVAQEFSSSITVNCGQSSVNGKSIMKMMILQATMNTEIELIAEGADEHQAVAALLELIDQKFGEDE